jgi:hypothetical protein
VAVAEEAFANVRADETRAASDEKIHTETLTTEAQAVERASEGKLSVKKNQFPPFCPPFAGSKAG